MTSPPVTVSSRVGHVNIVSIHGRLTAVIQATKLANYVET